MNEVLKTAREAYDEAIGVQHTAAEHLKEIIIKDIDEAVENGLTFCYVNVSDYSNYSIDTVVNDLEDYGYEVNNEDEAGGMLVIDWDLSDEETGNE